MLPAERDFYLTQSVHSDPGMAARLAELPTSPDELALLVRHLLIHREEAGRYGCALPDSRYRSEAETRYIDDILDIVVRLDGAPLTAPRRPLDRFAGTCRDFALLHCALLRHTGTPARIRCGYATYFAEGFHDDHWITEYAHPERGWVLSDPQMVPDTRIEQPYTLDFDPLDVPRDRFLVAGEGWRRCREGEADPKTFGVSVLGLMGGWMVRANVVRDLAALNRDEVLPWDAWGVGDGGKDGAEEPGEEELALLDKAARVTVAADFEEVRALYRDSPGLRVPATVTSYQSFDGECEVRLRGPRDSEG
ncbi:transglutaminase-like domain-containing protein [Streptomyces sp. Amel2xB2]|uniref:transglutaminase-like domain-containing protein n=1 Tax=Streptomyces sp. Amel2xB2 TaxID=1305829 RepID=UPI000DB99E14|nr:transglutaminase-like domain-containing protein [Streptomyces sp. Amel2xB2]